MDDEVTAVPARMLGLAGFEVLAAGEVGGELELLVQTTGTLAGCATCGVVATAHGRRDHLVRDIPSAGPLSAAGVAHVAACRTCADSAERSQRMWAVRPGLSEVDAARLP